MHDQLREHGIDAVWFKVAANLNRFFDAREWGLLTSRNTMNDMGEFLLQKNQQLFGRIMSGDILLSGQDLDNYLVTQEQLGVQQFLSGRYPDGVVPGYVAGPINAAFRFGRDQMPRSMRAGVNYVERRYGEPFSFFDTSHRILLGESMMSIERHGYGN